MLTILRFGDCEVHPQRHELYRDGRLQEIAPKALELLLLLLRERHRAVPKSELVEELWHQQSIGDSALARTLMKVRRAIDDPAGESVWIKTIHGHGYRFIGEVVEEHSSGPTLAPPRHPGNVPGRRARIAVLPCQNQTGDASLDWVQLGLMALVGHALEEDVRLDVVPMQTVLEAVGRLPAQVLAPERLHHAQQVLGLAWVVQAELRRQGKMLWLDYQVMAAGAVTCRGSLRDASSVALGERFAVAISSALFPGEGAPLTFHSRDPFANQAFARAIELWCQQQTRSAPALFEVVCDLEPGNLVAQLWRLRTLAHLDDLPVVEAHGTALLARAVERGDIRLQVMTHLCIGNSRIGWGDTDGAAEHYQAAWSLAKGLPDEWVGRVQAQLALLAHARHRFAEARLCYEAAKTAFIKAGNPFELGAIEVHLGMLDQIEGDLLSALQHAEDGLARLELQRRRGYAAGTHAMVVELQAAMGRFECAYGQLEPLLARLETVEGGDITALCTATAMRVFSEFGDMPAMQRVAELCERKTSGATKTRVVGPKWEMACHLALWRADLASLRSTVAQAAAAPRQHPEVLMLIYFLQLRAETLAGCFDAAAITLERIAAHPLATAQVEVQAVVDRAHAAERLMRGDIAGAMRTLILVVDRMPLSREVARARIDLAWLMAEAGDTARATALLTGTGGWRNEHPAGLAAQARVAHACGSSGRAQQLQQQALDLWRAPVPAVHQLLLAAYSAPAGRPAGALPRLARLCTDSWLPDFG